MCVGHDMTARLFIHLVTVYSPKPLMISKLEKVKELTKKIQEKSMTDDDVHMLGHQIGGETTFLVSRHYQFDIITSRVLKRDTF